MINSTLGKTTFLFVTPNMINSTLGKTTFLLVTPNMINSTLGKTTFLFVTHKIPMLLVSLPQEGVICDTQLQNNQIQLVYRHYSQDYRELLCLISYLTSP